VCYVCFKTHVGSYTVYINNSLHLARKYAGIFVRGHYLFCTVFLELRSRKTVRFSEQIMFKDKYPSIFSCKMEAIVFIILQIFFVRRAVLKIGEYSRIFPSFIWGIFGHVTGLDQSRASENIWRIILKHIIFVNKFNKSVTYKLLKYSIISLQPLNRSIVFRKSIIFKDWNNLSELEFWWVDLRKPGIDWLNISARGIAWVPQDSWIPFYFLIYTNANDVFSNNHDGIVIVQCTTIVIISFLWQPGDLVSNKIVTEWVLRHYLAL